MRTLLSLVLLLLACDPLTLPTGGPYPPAPEGCSEVSCHLRDVCPDPAHPVLATACTEAVDCVPAAVESWTCDWGTEVVGAVCCAEGDPA